MNIEKIINYATTRITPRLEKLERYYNGKNDILVRDFGGSTYHNRLVNNYSKNIVENTVGYWLGNAVTYTTEQTDLSKRIKEITDYNDDDAHNLNLARDLSIFGIAAELIYIDEDKKIRYNRLNPTQLYVEFDSTFDRNIKYAVRWYESYDIAEDKITKYAEYYDAENITYYTDEGAGYIPVNTVPHFMGCCPVNVFCNNEQCKGDFEDVISLIDAYDIMQSESINDFEATADAYLYLGNVDVDEETVKKMRDSKVIVGEAQPMWLTKTVNDVYVENIKNRLNDDIFKFSNTINFSDDSFGNAASGVALRHKLMLFENRVSATQKLFEKALLRRWEIICGVLNKIGADYDFITIKFTFTRNLPIDIEATASMVQQLNGIVSKETLLSQLPFIDDANAEIKKINSEAEPYIFNGDTNE